MNILLDREQSKTIKTTIAIKAIMNNKLRQESYRNPKDSFSDLIKSNIYYINRNSFEIKKCLQSPIAYQDFHFGSFKPSLAPIFKTC